MNFSNKFFKTAAVCSIIAGVLIIIYWLLQFGFTSPTSVEDAIAMMDNAVVTWAQWIDFILIFFVIVVLWGVAGKRLSTSTGLVGTGFIFFIIYFIPSLILSSMSIFTFNYGWASKYVKETDEAVRSMLMTNMTGFYNWFPAVVFVALIGYLVGVFLYGMATWKGAGVEKIVSIFFFLVFIGHLLWAIGFYGNLDWLISIMEWIVLLIAAVLMFLISAWLWKEEAAA